MTHKALQHDLIPAHCFNVSSALVIGLLDVPPIGQVCFSLRPLYLLFPLPKTILPWILTCSFLLKNIFKKYLFIWLWALVAAHGLSSRGAWA